MRVMSKNHTKCFELILDACKQIVLIFQNVHFQCFTYLEGECFAPSLFQKKASSKIWLEHTLGIKESFPRSSGHSTSWIRRSTE